MHAQCKRICDEWKLEKQQGDKTRDYGDQKHKDITIQYIKEFIHS